MRIETARLILRNWEERDRDIFHRINSDDRVMEFFPFRRDRATSDAFMNELRREIDRDGYGWMAAEIAQTGQCIGFIGLHGTALPGVVPEGTHEVGWRLVPEFWGKGYASEGASALLALGFTDLALPEIVSFAVVANIRSTAVMQRIGMKHDRDFDHPDVAHPAFKHHVLYRMGRDEWLRLHRL